MGSSEGPALVAATLLASPFLLDYDLTLLAFPLAYLAREGLERGFAPFEKSVLILAYLLPLASRILAGGLDLPDRRADHRRYALFRRLPPGGRTGAGRAIDRDRRIIE